MVMFEFKIQVGDSVVYENKDPRQIVNRLNVYGKRGIVAEIAVEGEDLLVIEPSYLSLANRPYDYIKVIDSDEFKKACEEYDKKASREVEAKTTSPLGKKN